MELILAGGDLARPSCHDARTDLQHHCEVKGVDARLPRARYLMGFDAK